MRSFPIPGLAFLLPFMEREGENATRPRVGTWLMRFLREKSKFKSESCLKIFYDIERVHICSLSYKSRSLPRLCKCVR
jgi:hypothetical protein